MNLPECQTKKLLEIVGEERHDYEDDEVSDAESVLERRLGGSREKRRCQDRMMGGVRIIIGLAMLTLGVLAIASTLEIEIIAEGYLNPVAALSAFIVSLTAGGTMLVSGIALIVGTKPTGWIGSVVQIATRHSAALNREGPWPEELIRVIGPERESHSDAEVEETENELRQLHAEHMKTVTRRTRQGAVIGAFFGFVGTLMVIVFLHSWFSGGRGPFVRYPRFPASAPLLIRRSWDCVMSLSMSLFGLSFPFLMIGSAALVVLKEWARKLLGAVFVLWIIIAAILFAAGLAATLLVGSENTRFIMFAVNAGMGWLFYWLLLRSIRSAKLRELCILKE